MKRVTIPTNLAKFTDFTNENITTHVKRFVTTLITNLVIDHDYYIIWFPSTLVDYAYAWYRSHAERFFDALERLQVAFLRHYRLVIGQQ